VKTWTPGRQSRPACLELMEIDNVASRKYPGFDALDILPRGIEAVLATMK